MRIIPRKNTGKQSDHNTMDITSTPLPLAYNDKMALLEPYTNKNDDLIARQFYLDSLEKLPACAVYFNGVADTTILNEHILKPLMLHGSQVQDNSSSGSKINYIIRTAINVGQVNTTDDFAEMIHGVFDGMLVLFFDNIQEAIIIDIHGGPLRSLEEPPGEKVVQGPREGFIEVLDINIALVRRHLRNPRLVIKKTMLGRRTRTPVAIFYIDDLAEQELVDEINARLARIDIDGVLNVGTVIQFIEDKPFSPFPQFWVSERPDKTIAELLEGRIAVMVDGSPTAFFVPSLFVEFFQAPEDYLERTYIGSYLRFIRFLAYFLSISLPALYVAMVSFTPDLLPLNLIISLAQARKEVPFPVLVEVLIQEFIIQIVIEAGLRLPGSVGQTAGVAAGIILGQAAISAKLASPAIIIIIAITAICTFTLPSGPLVQSTRILRLPLIFFTAVFGLYGFSLGWVFMLAHLCSLESLGVPYFAPFGPLQNKDLKDSFFRTWLWKMNKRPLSIPSQQKRRQGDYRNKEGDGEQS